MRYTSLKILFNPEYVLSVRSFYTLLGLPGRRNRNISLSSLFELNFEVSNDPFLHIKETVQTTNKNTKLYSNSQRCDYWLQYATLFCLPAVL